MSPRIFSWYSPTIYNIIMQSIITSQSAVYKYIIFFLLHTTCSLKPLNSIPCAKLQLLKSSGFWLLQKRHFSDIHGMILARACTLCAQWQWRARVVRDGRGALWRKRGNGANRPAACAPARILNVGGLFKRSQLSRILKGANTQTSRSPCTCILKKSASSSIHLSISSCTIQRPLWIYAKHTSSSLALLSVALWLWVKHRGRALMRTLQLSTASSDFGLGIRY